MFLLCGQYLYARELQNFLSRDNTIHIKNVLAGRSLPTPALGQGVSFFLFISRAFPFEEVNKNWLPPHKFSRNYYFLLTIFNSRSSSESFKSWSPFGPFAALNF